VVSVEVEELNALVGRDFHIGTVLVRGIELCDPCARPSKLSRKAGFKEAFDGRGGLRVEILSEGAIHLGDPVCG
jgi:MOSC domain-containing protein YiiM